jgi:hypothetical protein
VQIISTIPFSADVVLLNRIVEPGETVDVSDEQGAALLEQADNWTLAIQPTKNKE